MKTIRLFVVSALVVSVLLSIGSAKASVKNADVNNDRVVNILDLIAVRNDLGKPASGGAEKSDVNKDGKINIVDLIYVRNHLGQAVLPEAIIIDHTCTDLSKIPEYWIERAKEQTFHLARRSHGSQIPYGLKHLEASFDAVKYSVAVIDALSVVLPPEEDPPALRIYDGNPPEVYIRADDYWDGQSGMDRTRAVASTGLFDYSMWAWSGELSYYSVETLQRYLDALDLLGQEYPSMRIIYMTCDTDGGYPVLARNNDIVREYARDNNKVLYDYADIESWDPDGNYYPDAIDTCEWCSTWCSENPDDCSSLPMANCSHSHGFNCIQKAKAFWWMMARLAGWDGVSE